MKKALLIVLILIFSLFPVMADNIQIAEEQAEGFVTSVIYTMGGIFDLIYQAFNEQFNMSFRRAFHEALSDSSHYHDSH